MNLFLIRHTSVAISPGICYGQSDIELADTFIDEAEEIKVQLSDIKFEKVFSSPLSRCKKLSEFLFNSEIIYDDRLKELNFGEWELHAWDKINHPQINRWMTDFVNTPCPKGESFIELHNRIKKILFDLKKEKLNNVAIITHGGVIRSFIAHIQNEDMKNSFEKNIGYGEVIKLEI